MKDLISQQEKTLREATASYQVGAIKKTLNYKLVISIVFLNIMTLVIGLKLIPSSSIDKSELDKLKLSLLEEIRSNKQVASESSKFPAHELSRLRAEIREEINAINLKYVELTEKRERYYDQLIKDVVEREPASAALNNGRVLTYSKVNEEVLRSRHNISEDRLLSDLKKKESKLLRKLDLKRIEDQKVLAHFQDHMKTQMAEIRAIHRQELKKFREEKYLVVTN